MSEGNTSGRKYAIIGYYITSDGQPIVKNSFPTDTEAYSVKSILDAKYPGPVRGVIPVFSVT